jgi:hypothetical protein
VGWQFSDAVLIFVKSFSQAAGNFHFFLGISGIIPEFKKKGISGTLKKRNFRNVRNLQEFFF